MSRETEYGPTFEQTGWQAQRGRPDSRAGQGALPERKVLSDEAVLEALRKQLLQQAQHAAGKVQERVAAEQPQGIIPTIVSTLKHTGAVVLHTIPPLVKNLAKISLFSIEHISNASGYGPGDLTSLGYAFLGVSPLNGELSNSDVRRQIYGAIAPWLTGSDFVWMGRIKDARSENPPKQRYGYSNFIRRIPVLKQLQQVMSWIHGGVDAHSQQNLNLPQIPAPQRPR
jgi:hypothetical protein